MRKFLKVYFWIYIVLGLLGIVTLLGKEHSIFELLRNTVFWVLSPVCIFLYVYEKKWLPNRFWQIYFFLYIVDATYDFFYLRKSVPSESGTAYIVGYLFGIVFLIPAFIAIYRYAFKEKSPK